MLKLPKRFRKKKNKNIPQILPTSLPPNKNRGPSNNMFTIIDSEEENKNSTVGDFTTGNFTTGDSTTGNFTTGDFTECDFTADHFYYNYQSKYLSRNNSDDTDDSDDEDIKDQYIPDVDNDEWPKPLSPIDELNTSKLTTKLTTKSTTKNEEKTHSTDTIEIYESDETDDMEKNGFIRDLIFATVCIYAYVQFFIVFFSAIGIGIQFAIFSKKNMVMMSDIYLGIALFTFYFMYIMDSFQDSSDKFLVLLGSIVGGMFTAAGILFKVDTYPYGPLCLFVFLLPSFLVIVSDVIQYLTKDIHTFRYTSKVYSIALCVVAVTVAFRWIVWSFRTRNRWSRIRNKFGKRLNRNGFRCRRTYEENWMDDQDIKSLDPYGECTEIFLLWANPWAYACILFLYGLFFHVVGTPKMHNKLGALIIFVLIAIWVAASLAGAGHGIGNALIASVACAISGIFVTGILTRGISGTINWLKTNPSFNSSIEKYIYPFADVWRGFITLTSWVIFTVFYIPTEYIRYKIRYCMNITNIGPGPFTNEATAYLTAITNWNWTEVFKYAFMIGMINFVIVVIVAKFTVLCMAYVVAASGVLSIWSATGVITLTGMSLFLLPPVPGAPIYLAAGVLLPPVAKKHNWSVVVSIIYTACVCLIIKLLACTIQQKIIGEYMSENIWVKKTVGINSNLIRTTKLVLTEPGISLAKVCLLVGGPDWPTSVLCGILKLKLAPILIGTLPVWLLIWPTVLGGAFLVIEESYSQVLSTIFIGIAAFVQSGSLAVAAYKLSQESEARKCELEMIPYDDEILAATEISNSRSKEIKQELEWVKLPHKWKIIIILSIGTLSIACYITTLYPSNCFRSFAVNDRVSKRLNGNWTNIIRPLGLITLSLFSFSSLLYGLFHLIHVNPIKSKIFLKYKKIESNNGNNSGNNTGNNDGNNDISINTDDPFPNNNFIVCNEIMV